MSHNAICWSDGKGTALVKPSGAQYPISLLQKIRAGIAAAEIGNPVLSLPWLPPIFSTGAAALRANSTAYIAGMIVTNAAGTHQFVCRVGGTSAASEPATMTTPLVTTAPYNLGDITDGTCTWEWVGAVRVSAAQPGAPTITQGALPSQLTVTNTYSDNSVALSLTMRSWARVSGCIKGTSAAGANLNYTAFLGNSIPGTNGATLGTLNYSNASNAAFIEFMTDSQYFAFDYAAGSSATIGDNFNIEVDGRRVCDGVIAVPATVATNFLIVDFRSTGIRKIRRIRISTTRMANTALTWFRNLRTAPQDSLWFPQNPNRWTLAVVGDSITSGSASGPLQPRWDRASLFADLIGCDSYANLGVGSTGVIANNGGASYNYPSRIADVVAVNPDVVWINGAYNDNLQTIAANQAALVSYLQAIRNALPGALIIVNGTVGGLSIGFNQNVETAHAAAVAQFGDPNTYFIPASNDSTPWIAGTNAIQGTPTGSGNSEIYIGPTDTTHPSQMGILYLANRDAIAFKNLIASL